MQRQNHEKLFVGKSMPLSLHCKYFLVPSSWISKWRNYINLAVKNSDTPETLDGVIDSLMCVKVSSVVMLCASVFLSQFIILLTSALLNLSFLFRCAIILRIVTLKNCHVIHVRDLVVYLLLFLFYCDLLSCICHL